jgi:hypothetical protein
LTAASSWSVFRQVRKTGALQGTHSMHDANNQCCGSETFHYGSVTGFSMNSGSGSYFQKVPVSDATFFLTKYDFKGPKMAFQNIIFKEYLNLVYKNGQNYEITPFFDGFC